MYKDQLKTELLIKELVKPNPIEERLGLEVESLCETFNCTSDLSRAKGSTVDENDILF